MTDSLKPEILFSEIKPISQEDISKLKLLSLYFDKIWMPAHTTTILIKTTPLRGRFPKHVDSKFGKRKLRIERPRYLNNIKVKQFLKSVDDFLIPAIEDGIIRIYSVGASEIDELLLDRGLHTCKIYEIPQDEIIRFENIAEEVLQEDLSDEVYESLIPSNKNKETVLWHVNRLLLESSYLKTGISPPTDYLQLFEYKFKRIIRDIPGFAEQKVLSTLFTMPIFPKIDIFDFDDIKSLRKDKFFKSFRRNIHHWTKQTQFMDFSELKTYVYEELMELMSSYITENLNLKNQVIIDGLLCAVSNIVGIVDKITSAGISLSSPIVKHLFSARKYEFLMFYVKLKSIEARKNSENTFKTSALSSTPCKRA